MWGESLRIKDFKELELVKKKELGKGGYASVRLGKLKGDSTHYAVKVIDLSVLSAREHEHMKQEIRAHAMMRHPNIIKFHYLLEDDGKLYMLLEYAVHGDLYKYIAERERFSEKDSCKIVAQVALALEYIHSKGILHRDLKPENILLDENYVVKVSDFGWCGEYKRHVRMPGETPTHRVTFCGTYEYMAPEVIKGDAQNEKVDVWSLGILLYELLHGKTPFRSSAPLEIQKNIIEGRFNIDKRLSAHAIDLIRRILRATPNERYSVKQVLQHPFIKTHIPNIDDFRFQEEEEDRAAEEEVEAPTSKANPKKSKPESESRPTAASYSESTGKKVNEAANKGDKLSAVRRITSADKNTFDGETKSQLEKLRNQILNQSKSKPNVAANEALASPNSKQIIRSKLTGKSLSQAASNVATARASEKNIFFPTKKLSKNVDINSLLKDQNIGYLTQRQEESGSETKNQQSSGKKKLKSEPISSPSAKKVNEVDSAMQNISEKLKEKYKNDPKSSKVSEDNATSGKLGSGAVKYSQSGSPNPREIVAAVISRVKSSAKSNVQTISNLLSESRVPLKTLNHSPAKDKKMTSPDITKPLKKDVTTKSNKSLSYENGTSKLTKKYSNSSLNRLFEKTDHGSLTSRPNRQLDDHSESMYLTDRVKDTSGSNEKINLYSQSPSKLSSPKMTKGSLNLAKGNYISKLSKDARKLLSTKSPNGSSSSKQVLGTGGDSSNSSLNQSRGAHNIYKTLIK